MIRRGVATHVFFSFLDTFRVPLRRFLAAFLAMFLPLPVFGCQLSLAACEKPGDVDPGVSMGLRRPGFCNRRARHR